MGPHEHNSTCVLLLKTHDLLSGRQIPLTNAYKLGILKDMFFSVTGFDTEERDVICAEVESHGGQYSADMTASCTHLLVKVTLTHVLPNFLSQCAVLCCAVLCCAVLCWCSGLRGRSLRRRQTWVLLESLSIGYMRTSQSAVRILGVCTRLDLMYVSV